MANLPPIGQPLGPQGPPILPSFAHLISGTPAAGLQPVPGLVTSRQIRSAFKAASPSIYYAVNPQLPRYMSYENLEGRRLKDGDAAMDRLTASLANSHNNGSAPDLPLVPQDGNVGVSIRRPLLASCTGSSALLNLPTEILLQIIHQLNNVFSTCLGLTCKELYSIHRNRHGSIPLTRFASYEKSYIQLGSLLSTWAGYDFVYFKGPPGLFIRKERYAAFLTETHEKQQRQDLVVKRLVEIDLINWEAKLMRECLLASRHLPTHSQIQARKLKPWEWQCEKATASGFDVSWMLKTTDVDPESLTWAQYDGFMGLGFGR